jgi:TrmH family RNA methyltransferase
LYAQHDFPASVSAAYSNALPQRASARQLSEWRKLSTKKGRRESGQLLLEGARLVSEAVASSFMVPAVVISDDERGHTAWRKLSSSATKRSIPAFVVASTEFEKLADTVHAAGIGCILEWKSPTFEPAKAATTLKRVLVCDRIADPGNLGTLIRTAAAFGLDAVILLPETAELTNPKTVRAAAGALFHIPVYDEVPATVVATWAQRANVPVIVADAHRGNPAVPSVGGRWALVIGGETLPLDRAWDKSASHWLSLPLERGVESLNAGIAGAVIMDRLCRTPAAPRPGRQRQERT